MKLKHALFVSLILHLIFIVVLVKTGFFTKTVPEQQKGMIARLISPEEVRPVIKRPSGKKKKAGTKSRAKKTRRQRVKKKKIAKKKSRKTIKVLPEKSTIPLPGKKEKSTAKGTTARRGVVKEPSLKGTTADKGNVGLHENRFSEKLRKGEGKALKEQAGESRLPRSLSPEALFDRDVIGNLAKRSIEKKKKEMNGGVTFSTRDLKYYSYMMKLKERIESIWIYPEEAARRGIYGDLWISFTIKKDGSLGEVKLLRTSGYPELDRAAMRALKDGAPYWPLPEKWKIDALTVKGHFIYNLYGMYIR